MNETPIALTCVGAVVARIGELLYPAYADPVLHKDLFDLSVEDVTRGVILTGKVSCAEQFLASLRIIL